LQNSLNIPAEIAEKLANDINKEIILSPEPIKKTEEPLPAPEIIEPMSPMPEPERDEVNLSFVKKPDITNVEENAKIINKPKRQIISEPASAKGFGVAKEPKKTDKKTKLVPPTPPPPAPPRPAGPDTYRESIE